jgi:hypothetical protein
MKLFGPFARSQFFMDVLSLYAGTDMQLLQ